MIIIIIYIYIFVFICIIQVTGVKSIISNPATLESTSLVAAYGLDIFLTRRSPSNTFDVLSDSFNKPFLIITMTTVFIAVIYTNRKIKNNEFRKVWKVKEKKEEDKKKNQINRYINII